jgi:hypothetical protein
MTAAPRSSGSGPLLLALSAFAIAVGTLGYQAWRANDGHFVYAQDDPYIHLALARTLAVSGVWGVSAAEFAAASSSPGWTVLLALFNLAYLTALWPLVINAACAVGLIVFLDSFLKPRTTAPARSIALLAFIFVLPLPTLVFIGMEHTAHVLSVAALGCGAALKLSSDEKDGIWTAGLALAAITAALRYEGLFVVGVVAALAWLRGRRVLAVSLVAAGAVPVVVYAAYATAHGAWLLPNSIVIKSGASRFGSSAGLLGILNSWVGIFSIYQRPPQVALMVAAATLAALAAERGRTVWRPSILLSAMFIGVEILHVCFVNLEWFYRYEAYAVALGMVAVISTLADLDASGRLREWRATFEPARRAALLVAIVVLSLPLFLRGALALMSTAGACQEIYRQQYQMARFFARHYAGEAVAVNDIGAVSWMAPVRVIDLIGLASNEIAEARRAGRVNASYLADIAERQGVVAIAIYESHFRTVGELPPTWIKVGEWTMPSAVAVSGQTVAFFASTEPDAAGLARHLDAFARELPAAVSYVPGRPNARR